MNADTSLIYRALRLAPPPHASRTSSESSESEGESSRRKKKKKKKSKKSRKAAKKAARKKKCSKKSKYEDSSSDPEPFFNDVDQHINSILEMKEKEDASGKSRRSSLSLDAQTNLGSRKFTATSRPGPYSYAGGDVPSGAHSLATDIVNPKLWGETAAAAAWMPRSFYQEYVRTSRVDGSGSGRGKGERRRSTENMMATGD